MPKLSDTQLVILSTACGRPDGAVYPLTTTIKGGALQKVLQSLLRGGFLKEIGTKARETAWREEDGRRLTLRVTPKAHEALGTDAAGDGVGPAPAAAESQPTPIDRPASRPGTKQAMLIEMLRRAHGATLDELASATDWQKHTVRGAMAGALKKKLDLEVTSEKVEGRGRVYRLPPA